MRGLASSNVSPGFFMSSSPTLFAYPVYLYPSILEKMGAGQFLFRPMHHDMLTPHLCGARTETALRSSTVERYDFPSLYLLVLDRLQWDAIEDLSDPCLADDRRRVWNFGTLRGGCWGEDLLIFRIRPKYLGLCCMNEVAT